MEPIDFKILAAPFDPKELEWRVGQKSKDGRKAIVFPFVSSRAVQVRLDAVVGPGRWRDSYTPLNDNGKIIGFIATLEIMVHPGEWVAKSDAADTTDVERIKGGMSGALKRAAVKWGIGRYLYDLDNRYHQIHEGYGADDDIYCPMGEGPKGPPGHIKRPVLPLWALPTRLETQRRSGSTATPGADAATGPTEVPPVPPAPNTPEARLAEMRERIARLEDELGIESVRSVRREKKMRVPPETEAELTAYGKALRAALDKRVADIGSAA